MAKSDSGVQSSEQTKLSAETLKTQRMHILGQLAAGLAHDFNNLLEVILGFASLARQHLPASDPLLESLHMIEESAERAGELVRQMLDLAQGEEEQHRPANPAESIARVVKMVSRSFDRRIQVESEVAPNLSWVEASPLQLEQALLNLCLNARDAMPEGGRLTIEARVRKTAEAAAKGPPAGPYVAVTVRDTGSGMKPEVLQRAFEPFFSTKPRGQGTGLGLAMVDRILKANHGFVEVKSSPGEGTAVTINFPAVIAEELETERRSEPVAVKGTGTVLVVDDEPMVLAFVEQGLSSLGYRVLRAESGKRACEIYERRAREVDYVFLDVVMPEMDGFETYKRLQSINPQVRGIFCSGYSTGGLARKARSAGLFLGKPFTLEKLALALRKARYG